MKKHNGLFTILSVILSFAFASTLMPGCQRGSHDGRERLSVETIPGTDAEIFHDRESMRDYLGVYHHGVIELKSYDTNVWRRTVKADSVLWEPLDGGWYIIDYRGRSTNFGRGFSAVMPSGAKSNVLARAGHPEDDYPALSFRKAMQAQEAELRVAAQAIETLKTRVHFLESLQWDMHEYLLGHQMGLYSNSFSFAPATNAFGMRFETVEPTNSQLH